LLLAGGPMNVGQLTSALGMRQPALSHHLALMRHGRLVAPVRDGKMSFYELTAIGRTLVGVCRTMTEASM
jgi:DNA-binding transcriptional ArsR family regulator